jgi:hypothetical protein
MSLAIQLTLKSRNDKTGPIPVSTTSNETCPDACPLKANGCYAEGGPLGMLWRALSDSVAGETFKRGRDSVQSLTWSQFCGKVAGFKPGTFWRHNQAGDLPGKGDQIDAVALAELGEANASSGSRGFTYTHKPITGPHGQSNQKAIMAANMRGFTVNLSANNLSEADTLAGAGIGPVVVVLPAEIQGKQDDLRTPDGRKVVVCPATYMGGEDYTKRSCDTCQLCQRQRSTIVGFPAHGASKRKASVIANG